MRQGSRPQGGRDAGQAGRSWRDERSRSEGSGPRGERERDRELPPGLERAADEPPVPQEADLGRLPREVRAELRSLSTEAAEFVGKHLVAAGDVVDQDPALALRHAQAAKRRGARLPLVREALAETAYAAEDFGVALNEYRALRRMTGDSAYFPVMADCERALGKPEEALRLVREAKLANLTQRTRVELVIVEAGAREDLGQAKEGLRTLKAALSQVSRDIPHEAHARLAYAYAAMLLRHGQEEQAREWFATADHLDVARELDAADQLELLDGLELEFDFDEDEDEDEGLVTEDAELVDEDTEQADRSEQDAPWAPAPDSGDETGSEGAVTEAGATAGSVDDVSGDETGMPPADALPLGEDPGPLGAEATAQAQSAAEEATTAEATWQVPADVVETVEGQDALVTEDEEDLDPRTEKKQDADE